MKPIQIKGLRGTFYRFEDVLEESLKNPKFKKAYEALDVEFQIIHDILKKRIKNNITQKELAKRIGTDQATLSRLETGNYNPSVKFLKRVAKALDAKLKVTMV